MGRGGGLVLLQEGRISLRRLCDRVELLRVQPLLLNGCKHQGLLDFFWYGCVSLDLLQLYSRFRKFLTISIADIAAVDDGAAADGAGAASCALAAEAHARVPALSSNTWVTNTKA